MQLAQNLWKTRMSIFSLFNQNLGKKANLFASDTN